MARKIGIHLRLQDSLLSLYNRALALKTPILQCFFIVQNINTYVTFAPGELEECIKKRKKFKQLYLHASYWVNLSGKRNSGWRTFKKELELARTLEFTHIIIHPGASTGCSSKDEGIMYLAKALNKALERYHDITIVLENIAHGRMSVGGDLKDFKKVLALVTEPDRIAFCLDSAHAFSYGYDITTQKGLDAFVQEADECVDLKRVALLHANDSEKKCGSRIDKHAAFGKGCIGKEALQRFITHPRLKHVPVILELPVMSAEEEEKELAKVRSWCA